jgi:drug/metabolite transporter (DMT)-like permease
VAVLFGLLASLAYGVSDFFAGVASRRRPAGLVTLVAQVLGVVAACVAVASYPGAGPRAAALAWGGVSGVGSGLGISALYRGLAMGEMGPGATTSAVLTAVIPVAVGLGTGNRPSAAALVGMVVAIPSIAMVAWAPSLTAAVSSRRRWVSLGLGAAAGVGFALLFIALDRAGTRSGAWPVLPGQVVSLVLVAPAGWHAWRRRSGADNGRRGWRRLPPLAVLAGSLGGTGNLLFLVATGRGQLAVVAVLSALYPASTVILARVVLGERWSRLQATGMILAAASVALVSAG